jgi:integrase
MRTRLHPKRNLYETRISVSGKQISFYGKSEAEAEEKALAHLRSLISESWTEPTLAEFYQRAYLPTVQGHSAKWRQQIAWAWSKVPDGIQHSRIEEITRHELQRFLTGLTLGRTSVGHVRKVLFAVFALAEADDLVPRNPMRAVKLPPPRNVVQAPYSPADVAAVLSYSRGYGHANAVILAAFMGLRLGETLGAKWTDIEGGVLNVRRQTTGALKTASSARRVPVPEGIGLEPNDTEWIVPVRNPRNVTGTLGRPGKGGARGYMASAYKAGVVYRPFHSLRKFCATELERQGCPQGLISAILGHSSGNVTRLYIHDSEELMKLYLDKVCLAVHVVQNVVQNGEAG